jgi:predicted SprT family Zn-dependent metalloprotease
VSSIALIQFHALSKWAAIWCTPELPVRVEVAFSSRMTKSLGRARPLTGKILLNSKLRLAPCGLLLEVLCHEAAHVAVFLKHGLQAKPHGAEWRELVGLAGYQPMTSLHCGLMDYDAKPRASVRPAKLHRYRCPVCQEDFFVRKKSSRLCCGPCFDAGISEPLTFIESAS